MKKVLIVGMHDMIGGVETFIMNYYRRVHSSSIQIDFLSIYPKLCFEEELVASGSIVHKVHDFKTHPLHYAWQLNQILKKHHYDVLHLNMLSAANFIPVLVSAWRQVPKIIIHAHNTDTPKGLLRKLLHHISKLIFVKFGTHLWACSHKAGNWFFGQPVKEKGYLTVIHNAVDVKRFEFNLQARQSIREEFQIGSRFLIGHVGRFQSQKNHNFLIDIFASIHNKDPNSLLLLVGDGELRDDAVEKIHRLKLDDSVIFAGIRSDVEKIFQGMDVFILPSLFEGLPVVGIEAQAADLPVIAADTITSEMNITGNVSYLALKDSPDIWAEHVLKFRNRPRKNVSDIIRQEGYDIDAEANRLAALYSEPIISRD